MSAPSNTRAPPQDNQGPPRPASTFNGPATTVKTPADTIGLATGVDHNTSRGNATLRHRVASVIRRENYSRISWWLALLVLHLANIAYYVVVAKIYHHLPSMYTNMKLEQLAIALPTKYYGRITFVHAFIASIHVVQVTFMVVATCTSGRFIFYPSSRVLGSVVRSASRRLGSRPSIVRAKAARGRAQRPAIKAPSSPFGHTIRYWMYQALRLYRYFFGATGLFGVNGVHFEWVSYAREAIESALQTYQAYRMTLLLPRPWLNRGYVVLIVINSVAIPVIHKVFHAEARKRRLVSLLIDAMLDFASSIGVPIIVFITYAQQYTDPLNGFPYNNWFNDVWVTYVTNEFQLMMVVSFWDLASRIVFAFGLLLCMDGVKDLMLMGSEPKQPSQLTATPNAVEIFPADTTITATTEKVSPPIGALTRDRGTKAKRISAVINTVFAMWGLGVLGLHIAAEVMVSDTPCQLELRPWFASKPTCALLEIDCNWLASTGPKGVDWTIFEPEMISRVTIRHCSDLTISPAVRSFHQLQSLKVYNSTITTWTSDAALVASAHPQLKFMYLIRTNITNGELPPGAVDPDFPKTVSIIAICVSNLRALPDDIDARWPRKMTLALEFLPISVVSDAVLRLQPYALSYAGSAITEVPAGAFGIPGIEFIHIGGTRVHTLPRTVPVVASTLWYVAVARTNVSVFWKWMDPLAERAYARAPTPALRSFGTPLCRELAAILAGNRSSFSTNETDVSTVMDVSTPTRLAFAKKAIACTATSTSFYALAYDDLQQKKAGEFYASR